MARYNIILIASLLALVLFIAHTNAISWEEMEEGCRMQHKQFLNLKQCEKHIWTRIQKDEDEDEDENVLKMRGFKYVHRNHEEDFKEQCCAQLNDDIPFCRCQALKEIMENLSDKLDKSQKEDMEREVKELPRRCGVALPPIGCDLSIDN